VHQLNLWLVVGGWLIWIGGPGGEALIFSARVVVIGCPYSRFLEERNVARFCIFLH
jgi:hypothetical protein